MRGKNAETLWQDQTGWEPENIRRHRLYRAMHELMAVPWWHAETEGDQVVITPGSAVTPEAADFIRRWSSDLAIHIRWLKVAPAARHSVPKVKSSDEPGYVAEVVPLPATAKQLAFVPE